MCLVDWASYVSHKVSCNIVILVNISQAKQIQIYETNVLRKKISTFQLSNDISYKIYEWKKYQQICLIALVDFHYKITMTDKPVCRPQETF